MDEIVGEFSVEGVLFLYAASRSHHARERLKEHLLHTRKIIPFVRGEDLIRLGLVPGPRFRELLSGVLKAQSALHFRRRSSL